MKLLRYSFTAHHVPGNKMEDADALSRAPHSKPTKADIMLDEETQCHLNEVVKLMPVSTRFMKEVKEETSKDENLQQLVSLMSRGWPVSKQQ